MRIYVAGPYTAPCLSGVQANLIAALDAGVEVFRKGHVACVPHVWYYTARRCEMKGVSVPDAVWCEEGMRLLSGCSALLFLGPSPGATREMKEARKRGMVVYESLDEVPEEGGVKKK